MSLFSYRPDVDVLVTKAPYSIGLVVIQYIKYGITIFTWTKYVFTLVFRAHGVQFNLSNLYAFAGQKCAQISDNNLFNRPVTFKHDKYP